jgi:hypothetical protein
MATPMSADPRGFGDEDVRAADTGSSWAPARPAGDPDSRLFRPEMLMIGATGRNVGKTELACRVIRRHAAGKPIVALKVTTVERADGSCPHGGEGCGACSSLAESWCVTRELDVDSDKDTSKLLASGANEAYWLRVKHGALEAGAAGLLAHVPGGWVSVCESNSLSRVVEPGLFLQVRGASERTSKPSARTVADLVDVVVVSDGAGFDLPLDHLALLDGQWALRRDACLVVLGGTSSRAPDLAPLRAQFTQIEFVEVPADPDTDRVLLRALAVASTRSACDWCLVASPAARSIPAGIVNAMFRRRTGVDAVVARDSSDPSLPMLVLANSSVLHRVAGTLGGNASPAPGLFELGRIRELRMAPAQCTGERERS